VAAVADGWRREQILMRRERIKRETRNDGSGRIYAPSRRTNRPGVSLVQAAKWSGSL
jgi:hypothetical protein